MKSFEREWRYVVIKRSDMAKALNPDEDSIFNLLRQKVADWRTTQKKRPLNCVVVEQDWPEYETVWRMLEDRMTQQNAAGQDVPSGIASSRRAVDAIDHLRNPVPAAPTQDAKDAARPDVEIVASAVHDAWMNAKLDKGITSRKAEDGEELMVPYSELSERQKATDRAVVMQVYAAIDAAMGMKS